MRPYKLDLINLWRIFYMKRIPAYLTDEEIARKITECVSSATGNDSQEHNRKIRTHNSSPSAVWDFINTALCKAFYNEECQAYVVARGPWEMAVIYCKKNGCLYTIMREKRFAELQRTQARRNQSHYLDLLAGIINADLRDDDFNQMSMLPEKPSDQEAMKQQLLKLLYTLVDSLDELKRHVLILFNANYETGLTAIRAVTVNRMLTVIEQANWSRYIDLNNVAVVETVDEENSNFDTPDMGIKLTKKAEQRKKKVAGLKKWDESAEG